MPGASYLANYQNLRLNEVVIPGAHDAGIYTANRTNVQTQKLDISGQANAGCRFFDVRVAANKSRVNGQTVYTHQTYHLDGSLVRSSSVGGGGPISSHQSVAHAGGWGGGLLDMLNQARGFVMQNPTEFVIFKFSKCFNWSSIAEFCISALGSHQYKGGGNLNNKTVGQLAGKVITVFEDSSETRAELNPLIAAQQGKPHGIMFCKALYDSETGTSKTYNPGYPGLQYFGKFSSTDKVSKNTQKQAALFETGAATHMDVVGMMYWTTTGLFGNIRQRNKAMWNQTNVAALQQTWASGLENSITSRFGREMDSAMRLAATSGGALGGRMKSFMPNIVMMDFVSRRKCDIVDGLNAVTATSLAQLMIPAPKGPQAYTDQTVSFR